LPLSSERGGANLRDIEFYISYTIAVGGVEHIALIGHTQCRKVNLEGQKEQFAQGLSARAGWDPKMAEDHFMQDLPGFEIGNEIDFILSETQRLQLRYPKIKVALLLYKLEDHLLYWIQ